MPDGGETFIASRGDARKRKAGGASDGDKEDSNWPRAFFDPDQHGQPEFTYRNHGRWPGVENRDENGILKETGWKYYREEHIVFFYTHSKNGRPTQFQPHHRQNNLGDGYLGRRGNRCKSQACFWATFITP